MNSDFALTLFLAVVALLICAVLLALLVAGRVQLARRPQRAGRCARGGSAEDAFWNYVLVDLENFNRVVKSSYVGDEARRTFTQLGEKDADAIRRAVSGAEPADAKSEAIRQALTQLCSAVGNAQLSPAESALFAEFLEKFLAFSPPSATRDLLASTASALAPAPAPLAPEPVAPEPAPSSPAPASPAPASPAPASLAPASLAPEPAASDTAASDTAASDTWAAVKKI